MKKMIALLALLSVFGPAVAQDYPGQYKHTLTLGMALTDGNSETMQANAAFLTEGVMERVGPLRAGLEANYGESTLASGKETTVENFRAFGNAKKTISDMSFYSFDASFLYDAISQVDYRLILSPGFGRYLLKNDRTSLYLEGGPTYIWEKVNDVGDNYFALRFAERLEHALSATAKVWQSLEIMPKADDFDDYLLMAEAGVEAAMNSRMKMRFVLQNKHDSTPGAGLEKNDLTFIAGISVTL